MHHGLGLSGAFWQGSEERNQHLLLVAPTSPSSNGLCRSGALDRALGAALEPAAPSQGELQGSQPRSSPAPAPAPPALVWGYFALLSLLCFVN